VKVLIDMNLSPRWVSLLLGAGIEALHWSALGARDAPDSAILTFARDNVYVILTSDLDFSAILAVTGGGKPSVVQIRARDDSPDAIGSQIIAALRQMEPELDDGALLTINPNRTRMSLLPLRPNR
jgi:predicted nuclease of predicted toxin-antitoxin system